MAWSAEALSKATGARYLSTLTEAGQELAGELAAISRPFLDEVIDELGDGLADVVSALENLYAAAERVRRREDECS